MFASLHIPNKDLYSTKVIKGRRGLYHGRLVGFITTYAVIYFYHVDTKSKNKKMNILKAKHYLDT